MNINQSQPLVTVGIPCYNRSEGLQQSLNCFINQTYSNIEIIISDNCSSNPNVEKIARRYTEIDNRVRYIRQPQNIGALKNFELLVDQAKGKYFMWGSDDDWWDKLFLEKSVALLEANEKLILVSSGCDCYGTNKKYSYSYDTLSTVGLNKLGGFKKYIENIYHNKLKVAALIHGLFRKDNITGLSFREQLGNDFDFMSIVSLKGEITCVEEVLIKKTRDRGKKYKFGNSFSIKFPYLILTINIIRNLLCAELTNWEKANGIGYVVILYLIYKMKYDIRNSLKSSEKY
jgi:glycosyltransferase involved in cell wall biosynthesis